MAARRILLAAWAFSAVVGTVTAAPPSLAQGERAYNRGLAALEAGDGPAALSHFEQAAGRGNGQAALRMGQIMATGIGGVPRDPVAACDAFSTAAEAGSAEGAQNLATCFFTGAGRPLDASEAAQWYAVAASGGVLKAKCALGNLYIAGAGVARDVTQGVALCRDAAMQGDADAQADLGARYLSGAGVRASVDDAVTWLTRAAEQGQPNAAFTLGEMAWRGQLGADAPAQTAARWWRVALLGGRRDAARPLGDALMVVITDSAERAEEVDLAAVAAARAAYEVASDVGAPDARAYARAQMGLLDRFLTAAVQSGD